MKTALLTFTVGFISGALLSYNQTAQRYEAKAHKEQAAYFGAVTEVAKRAAHYEKISEQYHADYQEAVNREPITVTERVYVRANCQADAATDSGRVVGNAEAGQRAELHAETVRGATAVTDQAERDVLTCRAALHSLQSKIQAHNELQ